MRTLVDIGEAELPELEKMAKEDKRSRAALIRQAIDEFVAKRRSQHQGDAFGLWGERKIDGLAYQAKVRDEW
jgi:metal-responsive CopG/Arc/MetJ family transcriptional regulator